MTPQELKNSILQLAIQGRLVEQRPEEGTAQELYRQIQAEKQRLIQEGKIKKEKPLPEIAEDEKPFEIPESWMWVRLGTCILLLSGSDLVPSKYNNHTKGIPYITGASNIEKGKTSMKLETFIRIIEALQVSADSLLRPDVPEVRSLYQSEFDELLADCSPKELDSILKIVRELKSTMARRDDNT